MIGWPKGCHTHYVLGGQKMKIVINEDELEAQVLDILRLMPDNKILIDHFLDGAMECAGHRARCPSQPPFPPSAALGHFAVAPATSCMPRLA